MPGRRSITWCLVNGLGNVTLHAETEIVALEGDDEGVGRVRWRNRKNGIEETKPIRRVFLFAAPIRTGGNVTIKDTGIIRARALKHMTKIAHIRE